MVDLHDADAKDLAKSEDPPGVIERRRPGRIETISAHLIPLFRRPAPTAKITQVSHETEPRDDLAPARGIAFGVVLAIPLWALIGFAAWWALG